MKSETVCQVVLQRAVVPTTNTTTSVTRHDLASVTDSSQVTTSAPYISYILIRLLYMLLTFPIFYSG